MANRYQHAVDEFLTEMENIDAERHKRVKDFCDKIIAHLTVNVNIEKPFMRDILGMSEEAIKINLRAQFAFRQTDADVESFRKQHYESGVRLTKVLIEAAKPSQP